MFHVFYDKDFIIHNQEHYQNAFSMFRKENKERFANGRHHDSSMVFEYENNPEFKRALTSNKQPLVMTQFLNTMQSDGYNTWQDDGYSVDAHIELMGLFDIVYVETDDEYNTRNEIDHEVDSIVLYFKKAEPKFNHIHVDSIEEFKSAIKTIKEKSEKKGISFFVSQEKFLVENELIVQYYEKYSNMQSLVDVIVYSKNVDNKKYIALLVPTYLDILNDLGSEYINDINAIYVGSNKDDAMAEIEKYHSDVMWNYAEYTYTEPLLDNSIDPYLTGSIGVILETYGLE